MATGLERPVRDDFGWHLSAPSKGKKGKSKLTDKPQAAEDAFVTKLDALQDLAHTEDAFDRMGIIILPLLWLVRLLCCLDRCNLVFAALQMQADLNFSERVYGLGSGIFFAGSALFQLPSTLVLGHISAPLWLGFQCCMFGVVSASFATVTGPTMFYVLRLLLGFAEAGVFPCVWYYMTQMYPDHRLGQAFSMVVTGNVAAHVLAAPLAAAILNLDGWWGLKGWQWIFVTQAAPSLALGLLLPFMLPASVDSITWLTKSQKALITDDIAVSRVSHSAPLDSSEPTWQLIKKSLRLPHLWFMAPLRFVGELVQVGLVAFLPAILNSLFQGTAVSTNHTHGLEEHGVHRGSTDRAAQLGVFIVLMTAVPFTIPAVFGIWLAGGSERHREVTFHTAVPYLSSGICLLLYPLAASTFPPIAFYLIIIACIAPLGANTPLLALFTACTPPGIRMVALPIFNTIQTLGGFVGPPLVGDLLVRTGKFDAAAYILGGLMVGYAVVSLFLRAFEGRALEEDETGLLMGPACH